VSVPNLSHWDKQLGQAQPVPLGQADLDRLCLSHWDRQAACTKPVPLGLVKRDLSLSHGTSHIPTLKAFPCPGTISIPTMELVPVPLVPTCPIKWVSMAVKFFPGFIGGPEPLEKKINEILDSKREDRFSNPFFEVVQKTCQVHFSYLLRHGNFCKGPRTLQKFLQKCQKIAGC